MQALTKTAFGAVSPQLPVGVQHFDEAPQRIASQLRVPLGMVKPAAPTAPPLAWFDSPAAPLSLEASLLSGHATRREATEMASTARTVLIHDFAGRPPLALAFRPRH